MKSILITLILFPMFVFSQAKWEKIPDNEFIAVIQGFENSIPEGQSYSMQIVYEIFSNYSDIKPIESFNGITKCKNGNQINLTQQGYFIVQDEVYNIIVDTNNHQLIVQPPNETYYYRKTMDDVLKFTEVAEEVYLKDDGNIKRYSVILKKGGPYHSLELEFITSNIPTEVTIYSNKPYKTKDYFNSPDKSKVVLSIKDFKKGEEVTFKSFKTSSDLISIEDNIIRAIGEYKEYEVIDLRN